MRLMLWRAGGAVLAVLCALALSAPSRLKAPSSAWTGKRAIAYSDLGPEAGKLLAARGITAESFPALVRSIEQDTAARLREGEYDHLVYYLLQSRQFTQRPAIEPALSARQFVESLSREDRARYLAGGGVSAPDTKVSPAVRQRMEDFLRALRGSQADERLNWFRKSLAAPERTVDHLASGYARAMRFLYQKEFAGPGDAALYQQRGHSSDTRVESSFGVWTALSVLKALDPSARIQRVLVVGPGLDFAPRTAWNDSYPPQSYQPFAVADALLALGLAGQERWRIDCVDINDRVLDFFREFPRRAERRLVLLPGWDDPEYLAYFRSLGRQVGAETAMAGGKSLLVSPDVAQRIQAAKLNIILERYDPPPPYDLAIATNVLVYFQNTELLLALSNIHSMLGAGGYLIHNELRPELEEFSAALGFPPLEARSLRLSEGTARPLFDAFVIHRKAVKPAAIAAAPQAAEQRYRSKIMVYDLAARSASVLYQADALVEAPNWSRDGQFLLVNSGGNLYRLPVKAAEPRLEKINLGEGEYRCNNDHDFSRDGKLLAFSASSPSSRQSQVYVAQADGSGAKLMTPASPSYFHGWSPDGRWLAFVGRRDNRFELYRVRAAGGAEQRLTSQGGYDDGPEYSPDGKWIYFNSNRSGGWDIWRMPPDGAGPNDAKAQQVTSDELEDWFPHISPNGKWMLFLSFPKGTAGHNDRMDGVALRLMRTPGKTLKAAPIEVLAKFFGGQGSINVNSWSPDSKNFAYVVYEPLPLR